MKRTSLLYLLLFCTIWQVYAANTFLTDSLSETQWHGSWIGIDRLLEGETLENKTRVNARYLRKEFELKNNKTISQAKAFIAAVGYYELYVNGKHIGNDVLTPVQTDSRKSIIYNVLDITDALNGKSSQRETVGIILGNGRAVPMRYLKHYKCPFMGFPKCRVEIIITYTDGSTQFVSSNNTWRVTADGPIRSNNEYDGEVYDATKKLTDWDKSGYDDSSWLAAERTEIPLGVLTAQTAENQCAVKLPLSPSHVKNNIFDLKQNIAGWIALRVRGNRGDTIRIRYAEKLNPDSTLYTANLRDAESEDIYICNGKENGIEWHPLFVYHGGRYVEITGMQNVTAQDITTYFVSDRMAEIGTFSSSSQTLNAIYQNAFWGIRGNYHGFPTDCPQRNERQPWLGDRTVGSLGESYLFDNNAMYTRWMQDICLAQRNDGCIPDVAPSFWNYYTDNVTWPACLPFTCQMLYEQFGNDTALRKSYPYIKKWIEHIIDTYAKDNIIMRDKYGDWCMPPEKPELIHSEDPQLKTDGALISTAYMIKIIQLMHNFAKLQGMDADAAYYSTKAEDMTTAFNNKFLNIKPHTSPEPGHPLYPDSIFYGNNTATANILPLAFNIVPKEYCKDVFNNVVENIIVKNNAHVSCGVIGISHLLRTLTEYCRGDLAFRLATNSTYPSWAYMIKQGATTIWELWNGDTANPAMNSGNHVMLLGDLLTWCYQDLAGIKNAPNTTAYKHLLMKPDFSIQDLDSINASYLTPQGLVISKWNKTLEKLHWEITLPQGVTAEIVLPDGTHKTFTSTSSLSPRIFDVEMPYKKGGLVVCDEFVYDHSLFPETHSASIVELASDGSLIATYFGGTKERNPDVCIYVQRKEKNGHTWTKPQFIADGIYEGSDMPRKACWNPVLFNMPNGEVWLFFKIGKNVADWSGWLCKSYDNGLTWTDKERLPEGFLGPIKNKPILLGDSILLCPSSTEVDGWQIHFERYNIKTHTWSRVAPAANKDILSIQPSILVHPNGVLQAVCRTRPNKAQREGKDTSRGKIASTWSYDRGLTWTDMQLIDIPNNQSGIDAVTLSKPLIIHASDGKKYKNQRFVLIYNNFGTLPNTSKGPRTPLSLASSADGITWHHFLTLEDSPISQYSYPSIIQGADGALHCIYTWRRQRIAYKKIRF